ncbi:MAG: hypothetical protein ACM3KD_11260 [Hyphomicrobiaceae bacterium]
MKPQAAVLSCSATWRSASMPRPKRCRWRSMGRETMGKGALSKDSMSKDSMGKDEKRR